MHISDQEHAAAAGQGSGALAIAIISTSGTNAPYYCKLNIWLSKSLCRKAGSKGGGRRGSALMAVTLG